MPDSQNPLKRLLTVAEVADWLSVSSSLVYQLVESGQLPVYRIGIGRGAIRFQFEDVESYLAQCRREKLTFQTKPKTRPRLKHIHIDRTAGS